MTRVPASLRIAFVAALFAVGGVSTDPQSREFGDGQIAQRSRFGQDVQLEAGLDRDKGGDVKDKLRGCQCSKSFEVSLTLRVGAPCDAGDDLCRANALEQPTKLLEHQCSEGGALCADENVVADQHGTPTCSSDTELQTAMCDPTNLMQAGKGLDCWVDPSDDTLEELKLYAVEPIGSNTIGTIVVWCVFTVFCCCKSLLED
jgi:hypothetical protein